MYTENQKTAMAANDRFELPPEIIHHIQSFMDQREAARTTLISKTWYGAWLTRPNIIFDDQLQSLKGFPEFAKKTMQRYEDSNLNIQTFSLRPSDSASRRHENLLLAKYLTLKAIELGANDLNIHLSPSYLKVSSPFDLPDEVIYSKAFSSTFVLPDEVLHSKTLARLSVSGFTFDIQKNNKDLTFPNLISLCLSNMIVKGDLIRDLISRCPSIEKLTLDRTGIVSPGYQRRGYSPLYDTMIKEFGKLEFPKLKYLHLHYLDIQDCLSRRNWWAKLPSLKELVIWDDHDYEDVRICSPSLERITMYLLHDRILNAEFDVPNLRRFEFAGSPFSQLDFRAASRKEWESVIVIPCSGDRITPLWFSSLNRIVKMLSMSRVSLYINLGRPQLPKSSDRYEFVGDGLPLPAVEKLILRSNDEVVSPAFLYALFLSFRPKLVTRLVNFRVLWIDPNPINQYLLEVVGQEEFDDPLPSKEKKTTTLFDEIMLFGGHVKKFLIKCF